MLKITGSEDYYPTPESLLEQITSGLEFDDKEKLHYVLEPSAGSGNIAEYLQKEQTKIIRYPNEDYERKYKPELDIDCIEIEPDLRAILKEKNFRVVHDDFLTFHTYKHYDLILMNPPFSEGARHLLKAIEVQETSGGMIICLLNAETIRNAYTNERKELAKKLKEYQAEIKYYENAFIKAENPTDVEVACVKLIVPEPKRHTTIFETLREKEYEEFERKRENFELAENDFVAAFVALYNREIEWGLRLYDEYLELQSKAMDGKSLLQLGINFRDYGNHCEDFSVNTYVTAVRKKYWDKFFRHPKFSGRLTSNLSKKYYSQVDEFAKYDFSYYNIKTVQIEVAKTLIQGVEDCILALFDELSYKHSWNEKLNLDNIHYYNGWKTNLSWKINKRVILPLNAYSSYRDRGKVINSFEWFRIDGRLSDIEKALNYLDNGETGEVDIEFQLKRAADSEHLKNIHLKYFDVTFYKKGTCHLTFTNERLLKKLNIFGSQKKGWLPFGYGRRRYSEMNTEEKSVIDDFEGQASYNDTVMSSEYYLFDATTAMPMLGTGE